MKPVHCILVHGKFHEDFASFLKTITGLIARHVLNAKKGKEGGKFWDALAFTRLACWGRAFKTVRKYVVRNILEAAGVIPYSERKFRLVPVKSTS